MAIMQSVPSGFGRVVPPVPEPLPEELSTRALIRAYASPALMASSSALGWPSVNEASTNASASR